MWTVPSPPPPLPSLPSPPLPCPALPCPALPSPCPPLPCPPLPSPPLPSPPLPSPPLPSPPSPPLPPLPPFLLPSLPPSRVPSRLAAPCRRNGGQPILMSARVWRRPAITKWKRSQISHVRASATKNVFFENVELRELWLEWGLMNGPVPYMKGKWSECHRVRNANGRGKAPTPGQCLIII